MARLNQSIPPVYVVVPPPKFPTDEYEPFDEFVRNTWDEILSDEPGFASSFDQYNGDSTMDRAVNGTMNGTADKSMNWETAGNNHHMETSQGVNGDHRRVGLAKPPHSPTLLPTQKRTMCKEKKGSESNDGDSSAEEDANSSTREGANSSSTMGHSAFPVHDLDQHVDASEELGDRSKEQLALEDIKNDIFASISPSARDRLTRFFIDHPDAKNDCEDGKPSVVCRVMDDMCQEMASAGIDEVSCDRLSVYFKRLFLFVYGVDVDESAKRSMEQQKRIRDSNADLEKTTKKRRGSSDTMDLHNPDNFHEFSEKGGRVDSAVPEQVTKKRRRSSGSMSSNALTKSSGQGNRDSKAGLEPKIKKKRRSSGPVGSKALIETHEKKKGGSSAIPEQITRKQKRASVAKSPDAAEEEAIDVDVENRETSDGLIPVPEEMTKTKKRASVAKSPEADKKEAIDVDVENRENSEGLIPVPASPDLEILECQPVFHGERRSSTNPDSIKATPPSTPRSASILKQHHDKASTGENREFTKSPSGLKNDPVILEDDKKKIQAPPKQISPRNPLKSVPCSAQSLDLSFPPADQPQDIAVSKKNNDYKQEVVCKEKKKFANLEHSTVPSEEHPSKSNDESGPGENKQDKHSTETTLKMKEGIKRRKKAYLQRKNANRGKGCVPSENMNAQPSQNDGQRTDQTGTNATENKSKGTALQEYNFVDDDDYWNLEGL